MTDYIVIAALSLLGLACVVAVGILIWCRQTLLANIATVNVENVDPALLNKIEKLQLEFDVAEQLGYPGDILIHMEAQLNAAKLEAGQNPNAVNVTVVSAPEVCEAATGVFTAAVTQLLGTQLDWAAQVVGQTAKSPKLQTDS